MKTLYWLIRREVWEHTGILRVPAAALVLAILANVAFARTIERASVAPGQVAEGIIGGSLGIVAAVLFVVFMLFAMLYLLDSLHGERKDKSILFWRSLPVSDTVTVLSKFVIAAVVLPILLWLTLLAVQVVSAAIQWILAGGKSNTLVDAIGNPTEIFGSTMAMAGLFLRLIIWTLPLLAWFLFCSSWVSRTPIIMAVGIPLVVSLLLRIIGPDFSVLGLFTSRWPMSFTVLKSFGVLALQDLEAVRDRIPYLTNDPRFVSWEEFARVPAVWIGVAVAVGLLLATIVVRSRRTDA